MHNLNCILLPKNAKSISDPKQITHIKEILKSSVGDSLTIAEIGGNIGKATISQINNNEVLLTDVTLDKQPPAKLDLTVVLALPRPKVLRRLIMDMTSLGVNKLIIDLTSIVQGDGLDADSLTSLDPLVQCEYLNQILNLNS